MDVFSTEQGIRFSFVKTSEFRGGGVEHPKPPPRYATADAKKSYNDGILRLTYKDKLT
jgi:hypothetical protein